MMDMTFFQWTLLVLIYLLSGLLYSFIYIIIYEADETEVWLGIMATLWPLYIVLDILLTIAGGFGKSYRAIAHRVFSNLPHK